MCCSGIFGSELVKLVKVGASRNPGARIKGLKYAMKQNLKDECDEVLDKMECFEGLMVNKDTRPQQVIEIAKTRNEFIFLVGVGAPPYVGSASGSNNSMSDRHNSESIVRNILGSPVSRVFIKSLKSRLSHPKRLEKGAGLSEWIVCSSEEIQVVKDAYRFGKLDGPGPEGTWTSWGDFIKRFTTVVKASIIPVKVYVGREGKVKLQMYTATKNTL